LTQIYLSNKTKHIMYGILYGTMHDLIYITHGNKEKRFQFS
jgi:hypothetical protein